jgi:3-hydroxybutyryl-CoA dehydrogenase
MSIRNLAIIDSDNRFNELAKKVQRTTQHVTVINVPFEEAIQNDLQSFDLVINTNDREPSALIEQLKILEQQTSDESILSAFSTEISCTEIIQHFKNPSRFIGLHFVKLGQQTDLVEIVIPEMKFNYQSISDTSAFLEEAGFQTVKVKDRPGLLVYRLLVPYLNQAAQVYDDAIATAVDIDNAVKLGLGYPIGPLELMEEMGIENYIPKAEAIYKDLPALKYSVPPILKRMSSLKGTKAGQGFYK